jgi:uncharacterized membrane protein YoaK (UPF0700 family)
VARRDAVLLALTFCAGSVDAVCYLGMGQVFAGMMTGNLLILSFAIGVLETARIVQALVAMFGFAVGVLLGGRILGSASMDQPWPSRATAALIVELLIAWIFGVGWVAFGGHPAGAFQQALLALIAAGMGVQTGISRHLGRSSSPPTFVTGTPFVTGTLAGFVSQLASGRTSKWLPYAATLLVLIAGGGVGAFLLSYFAKVAPAAAVVALIVAVVMAVFGGRKSAAAAPLLRRKDLPNLRKDVQVLGRSGA